jgi:hypothetical protein
MPGAAENFFRQLRESHRQTLKVRAVFPGQVEEIEPENSIGCHPGHA